MNALAWAVLGLAAFILTGTVLVVFVLHRTDQRHYEWLDEEGNEDDTD